MARTLRRPMFRIGGMAHEQRTGYMGGGMTGVMSGITPRQPDAGLTPRMGLAEGTPPGFLKKAAQGGLDFFKKGFSSGKNLMGKAYNLFPQKGILSARGALPVAMRNFSAANPVSGAAVGTALSTLPVAATVGGLSYMNYPVYPKGHPQAGEFMPKEEAAGVLEKAGGAVNMATGKGTQAGGAGDTSGEAAMFDLETPLESGGKKDEYGNIKYATKLDFESPQVIENSKDLGLLPKEDKPDDDLDKEGGEKNIKDEESALMKAYKEYAPIFEKELGVSDDDTKKSLYMNLAKFGAGLMAQPGGDLVGAIGKAAEKPLEGAGETVKEQSTAKRQAKLLALQTAIKENEGGPLDKTLKSIAKAQGYKGEDARKKAFEDYKALQNNNNTATSADTKRYAESAGKVGLVGNNIERYIEESRLLPNMYPKLVGRFNEKLPEELDEDNVGAYYVSDTGMFVRVVEEDGEVVTIAMGEPGFEDKPKKKK